MQALRDLPVRPHPRSEGEHSGRTSYYFASVTKEEEEALAAEGRKGARERQRGRKNWGWLVGKAGVDIYIYAQNTHLLM